MSTNNFNISGVNMNGSNVVWNGEQPVSQAMNAPTVVSRDQLICDLGVIGLSQDQRDLLADAIEADGEPGGEPGPRVSGWLTEMRRQLTVPVFNAVMRYIEARYGMPLEA